MKNTTIVFGVLFIFLGVIAYFATGSQSLTALIPAFLGIPILILGFIAGNEKLRKHAMHGALFFALIGLLGSFSGLPKVFSLIGGDDITRPAAAITQAIMALLCLVYLIMGIRSFIVARAKS